MTKSAQGHCHKYLFTTRNFLIINTNIDIQTQLQLHLCTQVYYIVLRARVDETSFSRPISAIRNQSAFQTRGGRISLWLYDRGSLRVKKID